VQELPEINLKQINNIEMSNVLSFVTNISLKKACVHIFMLTNYRHSIRFEFDARNPHAKMFILILRMVHF